MGIRINILEDDSRYGKFDRVIDLLFCISSVIFAFAIPFQFRFTPWIAHWFFAVLIFKLYFVLRGKEKLISIKFKDSIAILALGCYGVWALSSTLWSLHPDQSYKLAIDWLSTLIIVPGIYIFSCKRLPITLMMKAFVCGCTVLMIYTLNDLANTALDGNIRYFYFPRMEIMDHITSVTYHHIYLGFIIAVSLFISSTFLFRSATPIWEKLLYITHSVLALFILAIDNSRIVTMALFISVFVFFICQFKKNKKLSLILLIIIAILIVIFFVFPTRLGETVMNFAKSGNADDPRFHIWASTALGLKDVPFLGYGYSAVNEVYANLFQKAECWFALNSHYSTHNQFMESYFTLGVIGISLIIIFLVGIVILIKKQRSTMLASMLILLLVSMAFEIPFCHCFSIPLLIVWFTFCHSGKTDMCSRLPKYTFTIPAIVVIAFTIIISKKSYDAVIKYSSKGRIETTDFSKTKFTKKSLDKFNIKETNIDMIICKGESGYVHTHKNHAFDNRDFALIRTPDTVMFSTDYFISEDFYADSMYVAVQQNGSSKIMYRMDFDQSEKNVWKSDTLIITPAATKIINSKLNQIEIRSTNTTNCKVYIRTDLVNATTFHDMKGYALFRNMKIETLHKNHKIND